jgi:PTH2 family peptidyl-tRNA hydrolase
MRAILNGARREGDVLAIPLDARNEPWLCGRFKKICVSVNCENELLKLHQRALDAGLITALIQDAGLTEFAGVPTYTALAIGPDEDAKIDQLTDELPLL